MAKALLLMMLVLSSVRANAESCIASVYSTTDSNQTGTVTASGVPLNDNALTAAHKSIPFFRKVRVTNTDNGKSVIVKITDRGPYVKGRCIDLTRAAARQISCNGLCKVTVEN